MALLLCLTTLTLSGVSSMASAVELSSDTYVLMDDVGIMPYVSSDTQLWLDDVFPAQYLELLEKYVDSIPFFKHYFVCLQSPMWGMSGYGCYAYIVVFDDYSFNRGVYTFPDGAYVNLLWLEWPIDSKNSTRLIHTGAHKWGLDYNVSVDVDGKKISTYAGSWSLSSTPFSDLGHFPGEENITFIDISNRREVLPQYATVFGLAVFLVLDILRGFWRSARGRDT